MVEQPALHERVHLVRPRGDTTLNRAKGLRHGRRTKPGAVLRNDADGDRIEGAVHPHCVAQDDHQLSQLQVFAQHAHALARRQHPHPCLGRRARPNVIHHRVDHLLVGDGLNLSARLGGCGGEEPELAPA